MSVPLTTYREARPWAVAIKEEILEQRMPPWGAASGYGHFANDMSLTGREISLILSWADGGAPSGVLLADEDKPPVFIPPLTGWEQGPPDATIAVAADQKIAADTPFRVERFEVNTGLKQARWLRALQLNPSDRRAIRYAAIYDARNGRWLGTWTPSSKVSAMPAGSGVQLPAGAKLTIEIGYRGAMEDASGAGELGLYFAEKAPAQTAASIEITPAPLSVAAGQDRRALPRRDGDQDARRRSPRCGRGSVPARKSIELTRDSSGRQRRADAVGEQLPRPSGRRPTS